MDTSDERLQEGIAAYKRGQKEEARNLIKEALRLNPKNERAWLWMSGLVDSDQQRRSLLKRVLAINPNNQAARRGLAKLTAESTPQPAKPTPSPEPEPPQSTPNELPDSESIAIPAVKYIEEPPSLLEVEEKSGAGRWLKIFAFVLFILAASWIGLALANPYLNNPPPIVQLIQPQNTTQTISPEEETAVIDTIYENIAATNSENIDRYMTTIHSQSPGYQQTRDILETQYQDYDLTAVISGLDLISYSPQEARVRFILETRKRSGPDFRDNLKRGIFILRPEDGQWKLYDQEIIGVEYFN